MGGCIGAAFFEVRCYALMEICYCITAPQPVTSSLATHETLYLPFGLFCIDASRSEGVKKTRSGGHGSWHRSFKLGLT